MDDKLYTMGGNMVRLGITILLLVGSCCFADSPPQDSGEANPPDRCVLLQTYNEGAGAKDWSRWENTNTLNGNVVWVRSSGVIGGSYHFDGSGDWIQIPDNDHLEIAYGDFSSSAWALSSGLAINSGFVCKYNYVGGKNYGYENRSYTAPNNMNILIGDSGGSLANAAGTKTIGDSVWHHVAWVLNRATTNLSLYIDGALDASVSASNLNGDDLSTTYPVLVGRRCLAEGQYWTGNIDEVMLFRRALTLPEIKELYQKGRSG